MEDLDAIIEQSHQALGEEVTPVVLRVTSIFRPEDGTWKIVHRHADPITTAQPAESVIQR
jgi:ketosteroid isomerase-like protein